MANQNCACEGCTCSATAEPGRDAAYCCAACADGHPAGRTHCSDPACHCGDDAEESRLDEALEETFPASDPIAP